MVLTIRVHHLESTKALFKLPREVIISLLIKNNYIESDKDPFVSVAYSLKSLFRMKQDIRLKIGGVDPICERCPKYRRKDCDPNRPQKKIVGRGFLGGGYEGPLDDISTRDKYNLNLKRTYTTSELRKIADF